MKATMDLPQRFGEDFYRARLAPPRGPVRVVIDTEAANEIEGQFAIAWALLSPQRLEVVGVHAAPCSFAHRRTAMLRRAGEAAQAARDVDVFHQRLVGESADGVEGIAAHEDRLVAGRDAGEARAQVHRRRAGVHLPLPRARAAR